MVRVPREARALVAAAEEQGWTVTMSRGCHLHFRDRGGRLRAVFGTSPGDRRGLANLRSHLRRAGLDV